MDWDRCYQDRHTPWEKGEAAPPLVEWLDSHPDRIEGRILVPGCGLGHDARALAAGTEAEEIVAIDIAPNAIELARAHSRGSRERYEVANLFDLGPEHPPYDWIWEHTLYCAIDPDLREDYAEAVHRTLKPGGHLLAVFFLDPYDEEHQPGGGPPHGCTLEELEERFVESGRFRILESYVPGRSYEGREGVERVILFQREP